MMIPHDVLMGMELLAAESVVFPGGRLAVVDALRAFLAVLLLSGTMGLYLHARHFRWVHYPWPSYLYLAVVGFGTLLVTIAPLQGKVPPVENVYAVVGVTMIIIINTYIMGLMYFLTDEELAKMPYTPLTKNGRRSKRKADELRGDRDGPKGAAD